MQSPSSFGWRYTTPQEQNSQSQNQYWQLWQQEQQRTAELQQQLEAKKKSNGIMSILGNITKGAVLDPLGDVVTASLSKGLEGLDWYDKNIVGNVWNQVLGPIITNSSGTQFDESTRYENLHGASKFGAGAVADPLNWLPAVGIAGKALSGTEKLGMAGRALSKVHDVGNLVQEAPIRFGAKAVGFGLDKGVATPLKFGGSQLAAHTDLGAEIARLGRPTSRWLQDRATRSAAQAGMGVVQQAAQATGRSDLTGAETADLLKKKIADVTKYYSDVSAAKAAGDTDALAQLETAMPNSWDRLIHGYATGQFRERAVSKRVAESVRRMATGTTRVDSPVDLDRFDSVVRDFLSGNKTIENAAEHLAGAVGNEELASQIALGGGGSKADSLIQFLNERKKFAALDDTWARDAKNLSSAQVLNKFSEAAGAQVGYDINRSTSLAREFMNSTRLGPVSVPLGSMANKFDQLYGRVWKGFIDPQILQPFSTLILGNPLFPIQNAIEEVGQQMLGGTFSRHSWHMSADEMLQMWAGLDPEKFPLLGSLMEGARQGEYAHELFGAEAFQAGAHGAGSVGDDGIHWVRDAATGKLKPTRAPARTWLRNEGWRKWLGPKWLELSNHWSSDLRRASFMNKWIQEMQNEFPNLVNLGDKTGSVLRKAGWEQRLRAELTLAAGMKISGKTDAEILTHLNNARTGMHQNVKQFHKLVGSVNLHDDTRSFLMHNATSILQGGEPARQAFQEALGMEFRRTISQAEQAPGFVDDWLKNAASTFSSTTDPDTLMKGLNAFEDARQVIDKSWHSYREEGARIASDPLNTGKGTKEAWKFNAGALTLNNQRNRTFRKAILDHIDHLERSLGDKGSAVLSTRGSQKLADLRTALKDWTNLTDAQANEIRNANQEILKGVRGKPLSDELRDLQSEAHSKIMARYSGKIEDADRRIKDIFQGEPETWFHSGIEQRNADNLARQLADNADDAKAISKALRDPSDTGTTLATDVTGRIKADDLINGKVGEAGFTSSQLPQSEWANLTPGSSLILKDGKRSVRVAVLGTKQEGDVLTVRMKPLVWSDRSNLKIFNDWAAHVRKTLRHDGFYEYVKPNEVVGPRGSILNHVQLSDLTKDEAATLWQKASDVLANATSPEERKQALFEFLGQLSPRDDALLRHFPEVMSGSNADAETLSAFKLHMRAKKIEAAGSSAEEARKYVWERGVLEDLLKNDTKSEEFLKKYGSIFSAAEVSAPAGEYAPFLSDARDRFTEFMAASDRLRDIPAVPPDVVEALGKKTQEALSQMASDPELEAKLMKTLDTTKDHYHQWFTNYDEGATFDNIMRHFFPFWRYEKQRWQRLGRVAAAHPWTVSNAYRYIDSTEDGYLSLPGGIAVNPTSGMLYNSFRQLMQDGGFYYEHRGGTWDALQQLANMSGIVPGPVVTGPLSIAAGHGGEILPANVNTILSAGEALPDVPGLEGISAGAHNLRQLPDRWYDYRVNQELAAMGINPYDATPEQKREAEQRAGRSNALSGSTSYAFKVDNNWRKDKAGEQIAAAGDAGVPEEVLQEARRRGRNPLSADQSGDPFDGKGEPFLTSAQRRAIEEQHPDWANLQAVRQSLLGDEVQQEGRLRHVADKRYQEKKKEVEKRLLPIYTSFARGEITGEQWRDARKVALAELRGAADLENSLYRKETGQNITAGRDPSRLDWLARQYYSIEAPTKPNGMPDFDALDQMQTAFMRTNNVSQQELTYIKDEYPRKKFQDPLMNALEDEYGTASDLNKKYYKLAKYPGLSSADAEKADKALELAAKVRQSNPSMSVVQSLAVIARYDPAGAQLARRALTVQTGQRKGRIPNPRKDFKEENPLWMKYYGN